MTLPLLISPPTSSPYGSLHLPPPSSRPILASQAQRLHYAFWRHGVAVDVISTERTSGAASPPAARNATSKRAKRGAQTTEIDDLAGEMNIEIAPEIEITPEIDLSAYRVLLLPAPMLVSDRLFAAISAFVRGGGSVWVGFRADLKERSSNQVRL